MPRLDDIKTFAAVVEAGGFRPAAQRLSAPPSTISDVVRRLEDELGIRLLQRSTRSIAPTDAGRALLDGVRPAFDLIERTLSGLSDDAEQPRGRLRLTVPGIVARYILPDVLTRFLSAFPEVEVEVSTDNAVVDIVEAGFDAAIRYEERVARDMGTVPIGPRVQRYVTAATPAYLARHGVPTEPAHLCAHRLIGHLLPSGASRNWEFTRGRRRTQVTPSGGIVASSIDLRVAAAEAGVGIIHTFEEVVRPSIERGSLRVVLEDWSTAFSGPMLCYRGGRHLPAPLQAFLDFLRTNAEQRPAVR